MNKITAFHIVIKENSSTKYATFNLCTLAYIMGLDLSRNGKVLPDMAIFPKRAICPVVYINSKNTVSESPAPASPE